MRPILENLKQDLRSHWKQLFLTDIAYKLISILLLTPLIAFVFRVLLGFSGSDLLADQDILFFLLGPAGWACFITIGALWIGIVALELAALMAILRAEPSQHVGVVAAIRFASANAVSVSKVTARAVAISLLVAAPFLVCAGLTYAWLLTEYDINFYLKEKPPEFLIAVGIGVVIVLTLVFVLLRMYAGWFFALPMVLFEGSQPSKALAESRTRAIGHRKTLIAWIVAWFTVSTIVSAIATGLVIQMGRWVVPGTAASLSLLTIAIGCMLLLWSLVSLAVNLLSMTSYASIHFSLYGQLGKDQQAYEANPLNASEARVGPSRLRLTPTRCLIGGALLVAIACGIGIAATKDVRLQDDVQVMAHRGASAAAPENTMAAIKRAIDDEADWVEIDVQETADGEVVVFHDSDFMKLAGKNLKIWDAKVPDLADIDIGSWFDPEFNEERVPTLAEVLTACKDKVGVNIELKYYGHDERLEERVAEIVEAHSMEDQIVVMSLKLDAVKKMKSLRPDWKAGLLMSVSAGNLEGIEADFLAVNAAFVDRRFVQRVHATGKELYVWTVNDAVTMSAMIGRGVDGLITDEPALAREVLRQRAQMGVTERLLLELADDFGVEVKIGKQ